MIYSPHFVWIHIGRTGGYMVDRIFRDLNLPEVHQDPLGGIWSDWKRHQTIEDRSEELGMDLRTGRSIISNFRRLPSWVLSFAEYKKRHEGLHFTIEELSKGMLKAEMKDPNSGEVIRNRFRQFHPDELFEHYNLSTVEHFWRTEHLISDCLETLRQWYEIPENADSQWQSLKVNANQYDRDIEKRFSRAQLKRMYQACPQWAALEERLYGGLL